MDVVTCFPCSGMKLGFVIFKLSRKVEIFYFLSYAMIKKTYFNQKKKQISMHNLLQ